jgi:WD40 repeat protein
MRALPTIAPKECGTPWPRRVVWVLPLAVVGAGCLGSERTLQAEAVHRITFGLQGPGNDIYGLTFTADGSVAALAYFGGYRPQTQTYADGQIKLWDVATGKELATLRGHARGAGCLAFSPDGRLLVSVGTAVLPDAPGEVKLWDVTRAAEVATFPAFTNGFASLAFSPDGKVLALGEAAAYDAQAQTFKAAGIRLWDVELRKERAVLKGFPGSVAALAFAPDGKTLASANQNDIKLWDVTTGAERATLTGHVGPVLCVAFSPDGQFLASGGEGPWTQKKGPGPARRRGEVKLWDVRTGKEQVALDGQPPGEPVNRVAFTADGKGLAAVMADVVKLWDTNSGKERARVLREGHSPEKLVPWSKWCDVWSTADGLVLVSRDQYLVKLWDLPLKK